MTTNSVNFNQQATYPQRRRSTCSLGKVLRTTLMAVLAFPVLRVLGQNATFVPIVANRDTCQLNHTRHFCDGNLGIARKDMPQIEGEARTEFLRQKSAEAPNAVTRDARIPSHKLKFSQGEINHKMAQKLMRRKIEPTPPCDKSILVAEEPSGTYYVVDGHHTATACKWESGNQLATVVRGWIHQILDELRKFPGVIQYNLDGSRKT